MLWDTFWMKKKTQGTLQLPDEVELYVYFSGNVSPNLIFFLSSTNLYNSTRSTLPNTTVDVNNRRFYVYVPV